MIEHIETSQFISEMGKKIIFYVMHGPLNSSKKAENTKIEIYNDFKFTTFQLSNKHNPEIKFSVRIKERKVKITNIEGNLMPSFNILIKRID
ncbi:unnamed protein product [Meloidogyne enterolobii]|uniref:Uncharacterized protein n=1 Tax=Meloidogyne enterolobii TaxID=390850 RepID=A0ACB0ZZJ1_MELEN